MVLIEISLVGAQHRLGVAVPAAGAAFLLVTIVGVVVARLEAAVGVMLTSFGVFCVSEGSGVHWPGNELAIPVLVAFFLVL